MLSVFPFHFSSTFSLHLFLSSLLPFLSLLTFILIPSPPFSSLNISISFLHCYFWYLNLFITTWPYTLFNLFSEYCQYICDNNVFLMFKNYLICLLHLLIFIMIGLLVVIYVIMWTIVMSTVIVHMFYSAFGCDTCFYE